MSLGIALIIAIKLQALIQGRLKLKRRGLKSPREVSQTAWIFLEIKKLREAISLCKMKEPIPLNESDVGITG